MSKFTPGPWKWDTDSSLSQVNQSWETVLEKGCCNGYGSCGGFIEWGPNKEANQSLITAAPDMYEALEAMLRVYEELHACYDLGDCDTTIAARLALAKAEGISYE